MFFKKQLYLKNKTNESENGALKLPKNDFFSLFLIIVLIYSILYLQYACNNSFFFSVSFIFRTVKIVKNTEEGQKDEAVASMSLQAEPSATNNESITEEV